MQIRKSIRGPFKVKGSDFWYVEIRGKRRSLKTGDREMAESIIAQIKVQDEANKIELEPKKGMPLYRFAEKYLEWSEGIHTEGTTYAYQNALKTLSKHVGEERDIAEVMPVEIDTMLSRMRKKGNSPSYCNIVLRHCRAAFQKAVEWSLVDVSPLTRIKLLAVEKKPPAYIEASQIAPFLKTIKDQDLKLIIAAYLVTGRRRKELLQLTWEDVDFENDRYYVRGKAHLSRWFPMGSSFRSILELMPRKEGRIWHRWKDRTLTHLAKKKLREAGYGHLHLHDLRHSFGVNFIESGGELAVLQDLMGHTDSKTTQIYGKVTSRLARKEVDRVGVDVSALA